MVKSRTSARLERSNAYDFFTFRDDSNDSGVQIGYGKNPAGKPELILDVSVYDEKEDCYDVVTSLSVMRRTGDLEFQDWRPIGTAGVNFRWKYEDRYHLTIYFRAPDDPNESSIAVSFDSLNANIKLSGVWSQYYDLQADEE